MLVGDKEGKQYDVLLRGGGFGEWYIYKEVGTCNVFDDFKIDGVPLREVLKTAEDVDTAY